MLTIKNLLEKNVVKVIEEIEDEYNSKLAHKLMLKYDHVGQDIIACIIWFVKKRLKIKQELS